MANTGGETTANGQWNKDLLTQSRALSHGQRDRALLQAGATGMLCFKNRE